MTPAKGADQSPAPRFSVPTAVAVLALIIIAPLVIAGAVNLHQFRKAYAAKVSNELSVMIERHSLTVDSFINDRLSDIRVIAREHPIERLRQPEFLRRVLNSCARSTTAHSSTSGSSIPKASRWPTRGRSISRWPTTPPPLVPGCHGQRELHQRRLRRSAWIAPLHRRHPANGR